MTETRSEEKIVISPFRRDCARIGESSDELGLQGDADARGPDDDLGAR
jgi:hypothetical protein